MSSAEAGERAALWLGAGRMAAARRGRRDGPDGRSWRRRSRGVFHSLVDVSHRQVGIVLEGPGAARLLAAGCPLDLDLRAFPVGMSTRTLLVKAEIGLWRPVETASTSKSCAPSPPMSRASSTRRRGTRAEAGVEASTPGSQKLAAENSHLKAFRLQRHYQVEIGGKDVKAAWIEQVKTQSVRAEAWEIPVGPRVDGRDCTLLGARDNSAKRPGDPRTHRLPALSRQVRSLGQRMGRRRQRRGARDQVKQQVKVFFG